jgi:hypothetical protein
MEKLKRIDKGIDLRWKQNEDYLQDKIEWMKDKIAHSKDVNDIMYAMETFKKHYDNYNANKAKYTAQQDIIILLEVESMEEN